ncbi:ATPase- P-type- transmembrane domain protein [Apiospora aurea]|uniref:ATPase- P-type- transmembrane domain protein n=1 Tax=Apiospora aurea TaxID=335848 RepID=A0ABR1QN34_9PEZI
MATKPRAYPEIVFTSTTPGKKLLIVRELQPRDGVNDAPVLEGGGHRHPPSEWSDIAMEDADMVLLEDSLAAVVGAVKNGRPVFDGRKKVTAYLISAGSWSEFWSVFTHVVFRYLADLVAVSYDYPMRDT